MLSATFFLRIMFLFVHVSNDFPNLKNIFGEYWEAIFILEEGAKVKLICKKLNDEDPLFIDFK